LNNYLQVRCSDLSLYVKWDKSCVDESHLLDAINLERSMILVSQVESEGEVK